MIYGIAVNAAGQIYVTGATGSIPHNDRRHRDNLPRQQRRPAGVPKCGEGESAPAVFVSKISANGQSLIYSTYLGGGGGGLGTGKGGPGPLVISAQVSRSMQTTTPG